MAEVLSREQPFWKVPLAEVCRPEREGRWVEEERLRQPGRSGRA